MILRSPKVWTCDPSLGGRWGKENQPTLGRRHQKEFPISKHPLQLYTYATPNGVTVTIMLEELIEAGNTGAEYDGWLVPIDQAQFGSGSCEVNPNSTIPAMMDHAPLTMTTDDDDDKKPLCVFELGNILLYLAKKIQMFLSKDLVHGKECLNWLFWQMGSAPFLGGGFGHFFASRGVTELSAA
jgi:GST-like protein